MPTKYAIPEKASVSQKSQSLGSSAAKGTVMAQASESHLVSFGDRVTYTFACGREVGSIHFDRSRGEIFYKGHNIRNMELEGWQLQALEGLSRVLAEHEEGKGFAESYRRVLDKLMDKIEAQRPPQARPPATPQ